MRFTKPRLINNMKKSVDFGQSGLLTFWQSMTTEQRNALVKDLNAFHALISSLRGRKLIETDKHLTTITVLKKDKDIKVLKELHKKINAPGIKIVEK